MQAELRKEAPGLDLSIVAINEAGHEDGVPDAAGAANLPLLQDTEEDAVWASWGGVWRDVYILDRDNHRVTVYNLTENPITDPDNYAELKALFMAVDD